jgi:Yip1 domain
VPDTIAPASAATVASKSLAARVVGVLTSPRDTYAQVAARPRWLGAFLVAVLVAGLAGAVFSATEVGQRAIFDQQVSQMEAWGRHLTDAEMQRMEGMLPNYKYMAPVFQFAFFGIAGLIVAGAAFAVFTGLMGGDATFKHVFAVVAHSGVVLALAALFSLPLNYARETMSSPTSLMVFLPMLDETSFAARLLGSFDLFRIWWAINLSIGLGVLYRRRTAPIAWSLVIIYIALAVLYAAVVTAL